MPLVGPRLLRLVAERQREHRPHRVTKADDRGARVGAEGAVVVDAGGDQRMGQLHQDGARPAKQHQAFAVDAPGNRAGTGG